MKMKQAISLVVSASIFLVGCGHPAFLQRQTDSNGKYYPTYGLLNESSSRSKDVCYSMSVGNVVWSIILVETIFFPVYFIGFSIYNPIRLKKYPDDQCTFDS